MGSLIRATAMWGFPELVRELGGDPAAFLARFHIPAGAEHQEDAFVSFASLTRMLEASAEELRCPDFGLRLSGKQGLHILGPIAVIARNAQTLLGGVEAIARYLYIHSPALRLAAGQPTEAGIEFTYEMTEPGVPYIQGYELSMGIAVRILRLLGGPQAGFQMVSFMHHQQGSDAAWACAAKTSSTANAAPRPRATSPSRGCTSARSRACSATPNKARSTGRADAGLERHPASTGPSRRRPCRHDA